MDDERVEQDTTAPSAREGAAHPGAIPVAGSKRRRRWPWVVGIIVASPVVLVSLWTLIALNWSYSAGYRAGFVQKFSQKGWVCKTWEGELQISSIPGSAPTVFQFTVRDDSVANLITRMMGRQVSLHYNEHPGLPSSCFGDTRYHIDGVRAVTSAPNP